MSSADLDVVRDQFTAVNRRDFGRAMELYAEDVVLVVPRMEGLTNPGTYEGKEAVGDWFGDWFRAFADDYRFELEELRHLGGGLVFVFATHRGRGRLSGAPVRGENAYLYRVLDGKISDVGFFATREDALQAAALPRWSRPKTH